MIRSPYTSRHTGLATLVGVVACLPALGLPTVAEGAGRTGCISESTGLVTIIAAGGNCRLDQFRVRLAREKGSTGPVSPMLPLNPLVP